MGVCLCDVNQNTDSFIRSKVCDVNGKYQILRISIDFESELAIARCATPPPNAAREAGRGDGRRTAGRREDISIGEALANARRGGAGA